MIETKSKSKNTTSVDSYFQCQRRKKENKKSLYKIIKIYNEKVKGYDVLLVVLANVMSKEIVTVSPGDLKNSDLWKPIDAKLQVTTERVTRLCYPDGTCKVIRRQLVPDEEIDWSTEHPTTVRPPLVDIHQAVDDLENDVEQEQQEEKQKVVVLKDPDFDWKKVLHLKYSDLDLLGALVADMTFIVANCPKDFATAFSREVHSQNLDMFRDGDKSIYDIRKTCHNIYNKRDWGNISTASVVLRLAKAIYHFGTKEEKNHFRF